MEIHVGTHIRVPWALVDAERVVRELTIRNQTVEAKLQYGTPLAKGDELDVALYENDSATDSVLVPRGYPIPFITEDYTIVDERPSPTPKTGKQLVIGKLRPRQIPAAAALDAAFGEDKLLCLGCVSGDTVLALNRGGKGFSMDIATAYQRMQGKSRTKPWDMKIPTYIRANVGDRVGLHLVEDIVFSGVKSTIEIELEDGKSLRLTRDHEVFTPEGYVPAGKLRVGGSVVIDGERIVPKKVAKPVYKRVSWYPSHPYVRSQISDGRVKYQMEKHRAIAEAGLNGLSFEAYRSRCRSGDVRGLKFIDPAVYHVHHKDHNHLNNDLSNLEVLPRAEHYATHNPERYEKFGYGLLQDVKISAIRKGRLEEVYDVICADPHHNFVANGIIVHNCGIGKTFLAIRYFMRHFGGKCLVIVDREFVADQWDTAILKHCAIPNSNVGRIGSGRSDMGDIFTISMIHTISQNPDTFDEDFFAQFDLVIFDEVHITSATTFRPVIARVPGERLGLTATPDRKDGMDPCFRLHLGGPEPIYTDVERTVPCTWIFKKLPHLLKGYDLKRCYRRVKGAQRKDPDSGEQEQVYALLRPRYETLTSQNKFWFELVLDDLCKAAASGRNVILLGGRTEHLEKMVNALNGRGVSAGLVVGSVKTKDRKDVFQNNQVICATWQLASRALDLPRLDTLFLLYPTADSGFLQQASGRIDDRAATGDKKPLVVVYCHKPLDNREEWYEKTGRGRRGATYEMIETLQIVDKAATIRFVNVEE